MFILKKESVTGLSKNHTIERINVKFSMFLFQYKDVYETNLTNYVYLFQ